MYRNALARISRRNFASSGARLGHGPDGPYSNIPFKVHNRKYVPYWVLHWGFFVTGLGLPGVLLYYNLKKAGNL